MTPEAESTESPSSRTARKDETQARIVHASMELFATRGYEGTSISAIAAKAEISRGAVFWHFGSKEGLFREACKRFFIPFWREVERSLESLGPKERILSLFDLYEQFVSANRDTIQALVRWVLESPTMRESLRGELLQLHAMFTTDLRQAILELVGDPAETELLTSTFVSLLAGNLLFGVIDPGAAQDDVRRGGLRILAERLIFSAAARARDRAARA
ncbi:MAG TPA: TetR/AcrR family transcriptional regulator [Myxococcota bacterium]|nr:TetR/AcrR family transcriptional regulator [Myxococcota bacterium]